MAEVSGIAELGGGAIVPRIQRLIELAAGLVGAQIAVLVIGTGPGVLSGELPLSLVATHGLDEEAVAGLEDGLRVMVPGLRRRGEAVFQFGSLAAWCALITHAGVYRALELGKGQDYQGFLFLASGEGASLPSAEAPLLALVAQSMETAVEGAVGMGAIAAREEEIRALQEIGKEISALTGLDQVLLLICRKAAELLGVQISYVALADKAQTEIRMRMTYGISESWRYRMWMRFGQGVGGIVAQTRRPLIIEDYGAFDHPTRDDIRRMVLEERIKAVVAVPMVVGDSLTGVLYAADRRSAHFSDHDARLLQGLADQAAIAITNSELYEQEHREVVVHDRLMAISLRNGDYQELAEALHPLAGNPIALYDSHLNLLACHPARDGSDRSGGHDLKEALRSVDSEKAAELLSLFDGHRQGFIMGEDVSLGLERSRAVAPALSGDQLLGYVHIIEEERKLDLHDLRVAERAAVILALRVMRERAEAEVEQRLRGELLDDLLVTDADTVEAAVRRSVHLGHDLQGGQVVVVVEAPSSPASSPSEPWDSEALREGLLDHVKRGLRTRGTQALTGLKGERIVSLVSPGSGAADVDPRALGQFLTDLLERYQPSVPLLAGVGGVCHDPHDFRRSYEEALVCVRVARSRAGARLVVYQDLGLIPLFFDSEHPELLSRFVESRLGSLLEYDRQHRSALVRTLSTYLDLACNKVAAAGKLNVHLSTLKYRLERIQSVLEVDLADPEARFETHLAVKALGADRLLGRPRRG
ncbi:MAG TPA: GAF domain-containing protein [Thermoleophilia bacterium]|nr:GAF domain-containing protein [Thermoleophilia bacterium]